MRVKEANQAIGKDQGPFKCKEKQEISNSYHAVEKLKSKQNMTEKTI